MGEPCLGDRYQVAKSPAGARGTLSGGQGPSHFSLPQGGPPARQTNYEWISGTAIPNRNVQSFNTYFSIYPVGIVKQERSFPTMTIASVQEYITTTSTLPTTRSRRKNKLNHFLQSNVYKHVVLLVFTALLLFSSVVLSNSQPAVQAANPGAGNACSWYRVHWGDTLTGVAGRYRSTIWTLARVNNIRNVNLIFVGQELCIPYRRSGGSGLGSGSGRGLQSNGVVVWYDYAALDWSSRGQVTSMLRTAAHNYGLPTNLLLAIAWQESG